MADPMTPVDERTNYIVWPNDSVDELVGDDSYVMSAPGLYQRMLDAGFPKSGSAVGDRWAEALDLSVGQAGDVVAYTANPAEEHPIPPEVARVFLDWRETVEG